MITPPKDAVRPLPIDLIESPTGLLYLIPYAPLTLGDCEALSAILAARVTAMRQPRSQIPQNRPLEE
ncbi:hypothetical protein [Microbispora hainanensis]|uniref:Uncharacterized protein n=1 Tax=Microbispora hainanensis TaxID=568844 RepID=A0A544Y184_9ACTN|nr:hypothetical protein [Microbispora hainanensis]TQS10511.1 hypothetical protein FLX08_38285 [Microbispora hainanensis]